ncbi:endo-1,4-beta-xylanase 3-like [Haliotis rufescens]|uniref:endo-1,4-beta-xylanase 3-like n=1 Tax=Haliotis rufescens TaxID=6454 RepID=UPI00201F9CDD|nr:endo-1,4-beta-xylanase 3-like [Haliotis rufescens]
MYCLKVQSACHTCWAAAMVRGSVLVLLIAQRAFGLELLENPGFESPDLSGNWGGWGFNLVSITDDVHGGTHAVKVSGRTQSYQGPGQDVPIQPGGRYAYTSSVKQLNDHPGTLFQTIKITIAYTWADDGKTEYYSIARHPFVQSANGWFNLDGDFTAPVRNTSKAHLYFQGPDPGIDFIVDDASLQTVDEDMSWKAEVDARIQKIRKNNINVQVTHSSSFNPADIEIKIDNKRHLFGFGSVINEDYITSDDYKEYQNFVYTMFNWVTAGSFKWKYNRGTKDKPDYKFATDAVKVLKQRGMKVRGHNMFWGVPGHSPSWVEALNGTMLKTAIAERVKYMTGITKGQLGHWDVNNELLHGQLYEEKTGDAQYSEKIYDMVHKADPVPKLFLNDYEVVAVGAVTDAYVAQAKEFKKANVGLGGLGLQSHFRDYTPPDPTLLKRRLDNLGSVGLPLWITEMDLVHHDENVRADWYDWALRTYFSHPAVEGVIFWGFWDHQMKSPYAALINGYNFFVNAAGQRYFDLVKKEWSTHVAKNLSDGSTFSVNGFHGDYDIVVNYKGKPVMYQEFHLGKADATLNLDISGDGHQVTLPTTIDPFVHVTHAIQVSHNNEHIVGHMSSDANNTDIQCVTRWSAVSDVGDDKPTYAYCERDEVMTGCSGYHQDGEWYRDGEEIEVKNGRVACKAVNGWRSKEGLQAVARCCKTKNIKCTYRGAGPSAKSVDARVETTCLNSEIATGCTAWTWDSEMIGSFPSDNQKGCVASNEGTTVGTWSYAACCAAPKLSCKTLVSTPSSLQKGGKASVACDAGTVLFGCSVRADFGKSAGAYIGGTQAKGEWCTAMNGEDKFTGEQGVLAVATCCSLDGHGGTIIG